MNEVINKEANISLYLPEVRNVQKSDEVFFNEEAKFSRDVSVIVARCIRPKYIYDLNSGSGAMGIRIASKSSYNKIFFYDINALAAELTEKNVKLNNIQNAIVINDSAKSIEKFEDNSLILIDPFGSPAIIYKDIIKKVKSGTFIGLKATDFGTLSGKYPNRSKEMYDLEIKKNNIPREVAIRNLILFAKEEAKKNGLDVRPVLSYATSYYVHIFVKVCEQSDNITDTKYINFDQKLQYSYISDNLAIDKSIKSTKIYSKEVSDYEFIRKFEKNMAKLIKEDKESFDLVNIIRLLSKLKTPNLFNYYYNIPYFCKANKIKLVSFRDLSEISIPMNFDIDTITSYFDYNQLIKRLQN